MMPKLFKHHHITPDLKTLHWLNKPERIEYMYKVISLTGIGHFSWTSKSSEVPRTFLQYICPNFSAKEISTRTFPSINQSLLGISWKFQRVSSFQHKCGELK